MGLDINTQTIRRMRDALLDNGRLEDTAEEAAGAAQTAAGQEAALKRVAPFAETMYLMMMADGQADQLEREAIRGAVQLLTNGSVPSDALNELLARCEVEAQTQGVEARLQAIGSRLCADRLDRETAFTLAAAVAMADDQVAAQESQLIESIAEWYGVSNKRCAAILDQIGQRS